MPKNPPPRPLDRRRLLRRAAAATALAGLGSLLAAQAQLKPVTQPSELIRLALIEGLSGPFGNAGEAGCPRKGKAAGSSAAGTGQPGF